MSQGSNPTPDHAIDYFIKPLEIVVPIDATQAELWFHSVETVRGFRKHGTASSVRTTGLTWFGSKQTLRKKISSTRSVMEELRHVIAPKMRPVFGDRPVSFCRLWQLF